MKTPYIIIAILVAWIYIGYFSSCTNIQVKQLHWINQSDTLTVPLLQLDFESNHKNWNATLFSFAQPISLNLIDTEAGFFLTQKDKSGVVGGFGKLVLTSGNQHFYYDVYLRNRDNVEIKINDYRTPKTVNPDSSLSHQKILFTVDDNLNLRKATPSNNYFIEEIIALPPTVGVYEAQKDDPITSYYVQPGSCKNIPITSIVDEENRVYKIRVGPLLDIHDNLVADGTLVTFIYEDNQFTYREEAYLLNGYANIEISKDSYALFSLSAQVDKIQSDKIILSL